ncbi:hypothetical protein [Paractinoplanes rishiriensis]|uniref:hypothetical protein n=1 Tax=Paractinoplanes rishiriensis TaxID=1050105 RepID=UPI001EF2BEE9|nr:hypothetical protein [Actinoplanes rishiriensis]
MNFTVIPVCSVKFSAISFRMSSICGLPTICAVMVWSAVSPPLPPVEPAPERRPSPATGRRRPGRVFWAWRNLRSIRKRRMQNWWFLDSDRVRSEPGITVPLIGNHRRLLPYLDYLQTGETQVARTTDPVSSLFR